MTAAAT